MHRESVYVCTYVSGDDEHVGYVRAWDDREAAEAFAREIELDAGVRTVRAGEICVRPAFRGDHAAGTATV